MTLQIATSAGQRDMTPAEEAAWIALEATVLVITRDMRLIGAGG